MRIIKCENHNWESTTIPACPYCIIKDLPVYHAALTQRVFQSCVDDSELLRKRIALLEAENAELEARIALLEAVAEAAMKLRFYHPDFFELHDALRAAGYLKEDK